MARIAVLSDVHANLAALEAVLRHAEGSGALDGAWCLGDSVGYGPQPSQCVARLRELGATAVAGNHDHAATGKMGVEEFNADAATAALWTRGRLSEDAIAWLDGLPEVTRPAAEWTMVHGTLRWPIWEYLYSYEAARGHLERQETPFSLVGHTHVPALVVEGEQYEHGCEMYYIDDGTVLELPDDRRIVLNPGGVGQPRDGDPRAAYALHDREARTFAVHRVEYDIRATQALMEEAKLPRRLIDRLAIGR